MADKFVFMITTLSTVLSAAAVILQLHGVIIIQLMRHQQRIDASLREAIVDRNKALARYRRVKAR